MRHYIPDPSLAVFLPWLWSLLTPSPHDHTSAVSDHHWVEKNFRMLDSWFWDECFPFYSSQYFVFPKFFFFSFFFYYSYVHTRLGSFLSPAPTPSLTTHSTPSLFPPSIPSRNYFALISNFVVERV
jgi:hypothetical protein